MKIAVCFSGQIRTGILTYKNHLNFFGELYPDVDFFMHTWDDEYQNPYSNQEFIDSIRLTMPDVPILEKAETLKYLWDMKGQVIENNYTVSENFKEINNLCDLKKWIPLFYSWSKSLDICYQFSLDNNIEYDYVIKLRPDILFKENIKLSDLIKKVGKNEFGVNHVSNCHLDDILFISSFNNMMSVRNWWKDFILDNNKVAEKSHFYFYKSIIKKGLIPIDLGLNYLSLNTPMCLLRRECPTEFINSFNKCRDVDKILYQNVNLNKISSLDTNEIVLLCNTILRIRNRLPPILETWKNENSSLF